MLNFFFAFNATNNVARVSMILSSGFRVTAVAQGQMLHIFKTTVVEDKNNLFGRYCCVNVFVHFRTVFYKMYFERNRNLLCLWKQKALLTYVVLPSFSLLQLFYIQCEQVTCIYFCPPSCLSKWHPSEDYLLLEAVCWNCNNQMNL